MSLGFHEWPQDFSRVGVRGQPAKSPGTIEDRDHLLAARAAQADAPRKQCSPGNRVRNSTEWHIAGLRAGSLAKTRAGRRDASNLSLGQRLGDEHTTLPIFKWLKSSTTNLVEFIFHARCDCPVQFVECKGPKEKN